MNLFFSCVLTAVLLQRLLELRIAKRNGRYIRSLGGYEVGVEHYRYLVLMHALFFLSLFLEVMWTNRPLARWWWAPFSLFLLAQIGRYWCIRTLGRFWNTRIFVLPDAPLVVRGPYRFLRHPNYLVVAIELLTLPLAFSAYGTAAFFSVCNFFLLKWIRIPLEEKTLYETLAKEDSMDNEQQNALPDFQQLNDRIIAPAPKGPIIAIRTNLDKELPDELEPEK
jgi:methyltransferase